jgi:hypothetical protein
MKEVSETLARVSPMGLKAYLKSSGWQFKGQPRPTVEIWAHDQHEILVPLNNEASDYARRISNFVEDLAHERRASEEDVARELLYIEDDVVKFSLKPLRDYVPLSQMAKLIDGARELAIASACSAMQRRAYHGRSRPRRATGFADIVGMGHTIQGSFVIPIISPIGSMRPVVIDSGADPLLDVISEQAFFPRRVTGMMADIFKEIHRLAIEPDHMPAKEELSRAVVGGLSADACLAVATMVTTPQAGSLDVTFDWALASTPPRAGGEQINFPAESGDAIRAVGNILRDQVQVADTVLYGFVSSLDREPDEEEGTVKVKTLISGRVRPVRMVLRKDAYHTAVEAHDLRLRVVITGSLVNSVSGRYSMARVDLFRIDDYLPMESAVPNSGS